MQPSKNFIKLCHGSESCRLKSYQDTAGIWTIGWGHTGKLVNQGLEITQDDADALFISDCKVFISCLNAYKFDINQNQFDALLDLMYNIGPGNFEKDKLLLSGVKSKDRKTIEVAFMRHIFDKKGTKQPGLVTRRQNEIKLYFL